MQTTNKNNAIANENVIRIVAFYVVILTSVSFVLNSYWISFFIAIDFVQRSFFNGAFSLLKLLAMQTARFFKVPAKLIFAAPKKFAASIGFVFSLLIAVGQLLQISMLVNIPVPVLLVCAILESVFGVCVGCYVFTFISRFQHVFQRSKINS